MGVKTVWHAKRGYRAVALAVGQRLCHILHPLHVHLRFCFTPKSKVVVKSPRPNTKALPPRGSRDLPRLAEGGALPYEGARHCPGFSLRRLFLPHVRQGLCENSNLTLRVTGPWEMIRYFHSTVRNPIRLISPATYGVTSGPP